MARSTMGFGSLGLAVLLLAGCIGALAPSGATLEIDVADSVTVETPVMVRATVREESGDLVPDGTHVLFLASATAQFWLAGTPEASGPSCTDAARLAATADVQTVHGVAEAALCGHETGDVVVDAESGSARDADTVTVVQ